MTNLKLSLRIKLLEIFWLIKQQTGRNDFSVGIVTYISRFEKYFKPNLKNLVRAYPDIPIYVAVNGFHDQVRQEKYVREISIFCSQYRNVKLLINYENQSLSKLWNKLILCAFPGGILILNDDIVVLPFLRKQLGKLNIYEHLLCTINGSWSHFWITPEIVRNIGWFDERFPGIGEEDGDYSARLALHEIPLNNINSNMLIHFDDKPSEVSWDSDLGTHGGKYTSANRAFIMEKYHFSKYPAEGFRWVEICSQYMMLKNGYETPDFYPDIVTASEKIKQELL